jgi:hypothetical protein
MLTLQDVLETVAYCACTVVAGTGILFAGGVFDSVETGSAVTESAYFGIAGNFTDSAVAEPGRVGDLRDCDWDTETGAYYELGPCADHERRIAQTPRTYPYPQHR